MSVTREGDRSKRVTLAFELAAFERFADPVRVIGDAREWSRCVGLVADDADAVASYVREHGIEQDFDLGGRDKWLALSDLREATDTPRHVLVGHTGDAERAAAQTGWEFVPVAEAADRAAWTLEEEPGAGRGSSPGSAGRSAGCSTQGDGPGGRDESRLTHAGRTATPRSSL